jgi:hypothetical protein
VVGDIGLDVTVPNATHCDSIQVFGQHRVDGRI